MRYGRVALVFTAVAVILVGEWLWLNFKGKNSPGDALPVITTQAAAPGGPFSLIDHFGQPVTDEWYRGKYLIMVFGYSSCPDVCPTTLHSVVSALALLGDKAQAVQPLFVTVDQRRDTPAVLAAFVAAFDSRLIGLTGSAAQIRQVTQDYRVYVSMPETGDTDYPVDHSAYVYVISPDGRALTYLKHDMTPQSMAKAIERLMTQPASVNAPWN